VKDPKLTLTYDQVVDGLLAAAKTKGAGHCDRLARYFDGEGRPACMVGHLFSQHGIRYEDLSIPVPNDPDPGTLNAEPIQTLIDHDWLALDHPDTLRLLQLVQLRQDDGTAWGDVLVGIPLTHPNKERQHDAHTTAA
jgi:hypothetical protein